MVCKLTHATTTSLQIELKAPNNTNEIHYSFILILLLQRCNYHLLTSCLINRRLIYRSEFYWNLKVENSGLKLKARHLKTKIFNLFGPHGVELVNDYESKWILKNK